MKTVWILCNFAFSDIFGRLWSEDVKKLCVQLGNLY